MRDFPVKTVGDTFTAEEFNESIGGELENYIRNTGITLQATTTNQMSQAATLYAGAANYMIESGVADAYILSNSSSFESPAGLVDGLRVRFVTGNPNTGASTVNVGATGVKDLFADFAGTALAGGEILANTYLEIQYKLSTDSWFIVQSGSQIGSGGGGGAVTTVFGRSGDVVPVAGDYDSDQITNASTVTGSTVSDALETLSTAASAPFLPAGNAIGAYTIVTRGFATALNTGGSESGSALFSLTLRETGNNQPLQVKTRSFLAIGGTWRLMSNNVTQANDVGLYMRIA